MIKERRKSLKKFFEKIYGDLEGWIFTAYKDHEKDDFGQKKYSNEQVDTMLDEIFSYNDKASIYFCPHLFETNGKGRVKGNSLETKCLWVDKDKGKLDELKPKPTICWQTSEGRWQAVWVLDRYIDIETAELLNKNLVEQTKGDPGGWHAGKLLRVPDSVNHKYSPPFQGYFLWSDGPVYPPHKFAKEEKTPEQKELEELAEQPDVPQKLPTYAQAITVHGRRIPGAAWDLLQTPPKKGESWSEPLWRLEVLLLQSGIPEKDVFAIVRESHWNKYKRDGRHEKDLWKEVLKASKEQEIETPSDEEVHELPWVSLDKLMLHAERPEWLVEDIWMDKNVGWIAGEGKSYKSVMSLDLALSVASGTPFLDTYKVNKPGPVLMVQEEDPMWRVAHRVKTMANHKDLMKIDIVASEEKFSMSVQPTNVPLYVSCGGSFAFADETRMEALERTIDAVRPRLVVLDPMFMMAVGYDEFKAGEITSVLNVLKQWRNEYDCAIAVVHHFNKGQGSDITKLYGSMALYAWSENSLLVQRESREQNLISIRRDIKDSPSDEIIGLEFFDIDLTYDFQFREMTDDKSVHAGHAEIVIKELYAASGGDEVTLSEIAERLGLSSKSARNHITELERQGKVKAEARGRGGKLYIKPTPLLAEGTPGGLL